MFHYVDWDSQWWHHLLVCCLWAAWGGPTTSAICDPSEFLITMGLACISEVISSTTTYTPEYSKSSLVPSPLPDFISQSCFTTVARYNPGVAHEWGYVQRMIVVPWNYNMYWSLYHLLFCVSGLTTDWQWEFCICAPYAGLPLCRTKWNWSEPWCSMPWGNRNKCIRMSGWRAHCSMGCGGRGKHCSMSWLQPLMCTHLYTVVIICKDLL